MNNNFIQQFSAMFTCLHDKGGEESGDRNENLKFYFIVHKKPLWWTFFKNHIKKPHRLIFRSPPPKKKKKKSCNNSKFVRNNEKLSFKLQKS